MPSMIFLPVSYHIARSLSVDSNHLCMEVYINLLFFNLKLAELQTSKKKDEGRLNFLIYGLKSRKIRKESFGCSFSHENRCVIYGLLEKKIQDL